MNDTRFTQTNTTFAMSCSVAVSIEVNAEVVWGLLTDAEGFPRWNSTVTGIEGQIREGERLRLHVPGTSRTFSPRVSDVVPARRMIWSDGYRGADFTAHIYPDAAATLRDWHAAGLPLAVYSSGSVPAQKLFFGHTDAGDLTGLFEGWFDTEVGHKREAGSYAEIARRLGRLPEDVLFLSDVVEELDAAREAGLRTVLVDRLDDYPQPRLGDAAHGHARVERFDQVALD